MRRLTPPFLNPPHWFFQRKLIVESFYNAKAEDRACQIQIRSGGRYGPLRKVGGGSMDDVVSLRMRVRGEIVPAESKEKRRLC